MENMNDFSSNGEVVQVMKQNPQETAGEKVVVARRKR